MHATIARSLDRQKKIRTFVDKLRTKALQYIYMSRVPFANRIIV